MRKIEDKCIKAKETAYKWKWVGTSVGECLQVKMSECKWGSSRVSTIEEWVQLKLGEYKLRRVHDSEGECVQLKESAYEWKRVDISEGKCVQVKMSECKWKTVRSSKGQCIQMKMSAYKWRWVNTIKESAYKWIPVLIFFLKHLSGPESDWIIARAPAVRIFPSGSRVRTATNFPAFASFPAVFFSLQRT